MSLDKKQYIDYHNGFDYTNKLGKLKIGNNLFEYRKIIKESKKDFELMKQAVEKEGILNDFYNNFTNIINFLLEKKVLVQGEDFLDISNLNEDDINKVKNFVYEINLFYINKIQKNNLFTNKEKEKIGKDLSNIDDLVSQIIESYNAIRSIFSNDDEK